MPQPSTATSVATPPASINPPSFSKRASDSIRVHEALDSVCQRVAPVWPLADYVAVNPYLGFSKDGFFATSQRFREFSDCRMLMPLDYYRQCFGAGEFDSTHVDLAIDELVESRVPGAEYLTGHDLLSVLRSSGDDFGSAVGRSAVPSTRSISSVFDQRHESDWTTFIHDEIGKHCAAYYDEGQSLWANPWKGESLYAAWRAAMRHDRTASILGLSGLGGLVSDLPGRPEDAVVELMRSAGVPADRHDSYLLCLAYEQPGWAAWAQYRSKWLQDGQSKAGDGTGNDLVALLAMRMAYDVAVARSFGFEPEWPPADSEEALPPGVVDANSDVTLYALHRANEIGYRDKLLSALGASLTASSHPMRSQKLAQMVFCIDVRSERIRRQLESVDDRITTLGFAGFFGLPISVIAPGEPRATNQLPVLVAPRIAVKEEVRDANESARAHVVSQRTLVRRMRKSWKAFQRSAVSAFAFVETTGPFFGLKLAARSLGYGATSGGSRYDGVSKAERDRLGPSLTSLRANGLDVEAQADLAVSILRGMGLTADFAQLVVFCGHGCQTENNPLKAGLDCGACGGHSGEPNARLAAQLMNDPEVRRGLAERGIKIPQDTWFLAALHNTTTDEIAFFDEDLVPASHAQAIDELKTTTQRAGVQTRQERRRVMDSNTDSGMNRRARDWSEVRPEWGLTGNAAFVVGPRSFTESADLQGRVFLHTYDHRIDPEGQVLEAILTAPMVVASWINLQYFASTVDQRHFGSGAKTIHNVVGGFGVFAGNGGDLKTGLPWESIHDGESYRHDPVRLQVVVAAPRETIGEILQRHTSVRDLITNGWIHLVACDEESFYRLTSNAMWEPVPTTARPAPSEVAASA